MDANEYQKKKLRKGLYRELVHWYENAMWQIKRYDRNNGGVGFFETPEMKLGSRIIIGNSIYQAEANPQISRQDLKNKIRDLRVIFHVLEKELPKKTSLYAKTLADNKAMQYFYQLDDSEIISACYDNFRNAFAFDELYPPNAFPRSRLLTPEEAGKLTRLEMRLDALRNACATFEFHENHGELDKSLLAAMRRGKKRGTLVNTSGTGRETSRWCLACGTYSDPVAILVQFKAPVYEVCEHCRKKLPSVKELSKNLGRNDDKKRKNAADALVKTYEYNTVELDRDNVDALLTALSDTLLEVRKNAALGLAHIGKRLEKSDIERDGNALKDKAVKALTKKLSDKSEDTKVRKAAAEGIGKIYKSRKNGAGVARRPLKLALRDSNDDIRGAAAGAVGNIGDKDLFLSLETSLLGAKSGTSQAAIIRAMGCFGKKSVDRLVQVLCDDEKPTLTRMWAAHVLGSVADPSEVWEPLNQIANEQSADPHLKVNAEGALRLLAPQYRSDQKKRARKNILLCEIATRSRAKSMRVKWPLD